MIWPCISDHFIYEGIILGILVQLGTVNDRILFANRCDIFHGSVILHCILDSIKYEGIILWIFVQSDTVNDLILFAVHCDPYFMVR